jgi:hypothetical protein
VLTAIAMRLAKASTCTEWSMTSSDGSCGLVFDASPVSSCIAWRIAARSTIAGTPVKSWWITRAGVNAISRDGSSFAAHCATASTLSGVEVRRTFSSKIFSV